MEGQGGEVEGVAEYLVEMKESFFLIPNLC